MDTQHMLAVLSAQSAYLQQLTREISDSLQHLEQPGPETPPAEATTDPSHQLQLLTHCLLAEAGCFQRRLEMFLTGSPSRSSHQERGRREVGTSQHNY